MTVLSSSYGIIMDRAINAPVHGNNAVDGFNATYKCSLKGQMEIIGKLASNETSKIGLIQISSKDISIKIVDQFIHIYKYFKGALMLTTEV